MYWLALVLYCSISILFYITKIREKCYRKSYAHRLKLSEHLLKSYEKLVQPNGDDSDGIVNVKVADLTLIRVQSLVSLSHS
jgi:hypothetical protein